MAKQPIGQLTDLEKEIIHLELKKSDINREKARLVLNKSLVLYFGFLLVAVFGFIYKYIDALLLNVLIVMSVFILLLGALPYILTVNREEKKISRILNDLRGRNK